MAVNKNFVVKNGIEVATDLIFASSALDKVGIGSTIPTKLLEVGGDSKLTGNTTLVGFATVQDTFEVGTGGTVLTVDVQAGRIGLNTATAHHNVHISNVGSGSTTLLVDGGDLKVDGNIFGGDLVSAPRLNITGIATFGDGTGADKVDINADVDMDANLHLTGVATVTGLIDANGGINVTTAKVEDLTDNRVIISGTGGELEDDGNLTFDGTGLVIGGSKHLSVAGMTTATGGLRIGTGGTVGPASGGIVTYYGDGSQLTNVTATSGGTLGFSTAGAVGYGVTLLNFIGAGTSTISVPHSGIATLTIVGGGGGGSANIGIGTTVGDAFSGIITSGNLWYNTNEARLFIYYFDGSSSQWVDAAPFNIGIITSGLRSLSQGTALSPSLAFSGDSSTGLFSPATGKQTFVSVGSSILNINPGGVEVTGVTTVGIVTSGTSVSASRFYGDGSALTGIVAGATLSAGSGDQRIVLTSQTSGSMTAAATDAELTYNSTSNTLSATTFSGALSGNATSATNASGLTGTPDITIRNLTGVAATFTGVLTYEDVTNVDSVGVVTARAGIKFGLAGVGGTITADGHAEFAGVCTATEYYGDGSNLSGISAGISTTSSSPAANTVVILNLSTAQHHDLTLTAGITTITCSGGSFGDSHTVAISQPSSGIATVGFSSYFLFPSGSPPSMTEGGSAIDLLSFVVKRQGVTGIGTQLLASAGLNYSN
jgi:hypothetical protein